MKSDCENNRRRQQQPTWPGTHLKPSHCALSPFSGHIPRLRMMFSLEPPRHRGMVIREIKILRSVADPIGSIAHFRSFLTVSPAIFWSFRHLSSRKSITSATLIAWGIIEKKKASCKAICFRLKNIIHSDGESDSSCESSSSSSRRCS